MTAPPPCTRGLSSMALDVYILRARVARARREPAADVCTLRRAGRARSPPGRAATGRSYGGRSKGGIWYSDIQLYRTLTYIRPYIIVSFLCHEYIAVS